MTEEHITQHTLSTIFQNSTRDKITITNSNPYHTFLSPGAINVKYFFPCLLSTFCRKLSERNSVGKYGAGKRDMDTCRVLLDDDEKRLHDEWQQQQS